MIFTITVPGAETTPTTTSTSKTTSTSTLTTTTTIKPASTSTKTTTTTTTITTTSTIKPASTLTPTTKDNNENDTIIALIIFLVSILLMVIVCGFVRVFKDRTIKIKCGFLEEEDNDKAKLYCCCCTVLKYEHIPDENQEKPLLCDNNAASGGHFETEYSISSKKQMDGNGNTINVINLLSDPKKRFEADRIKEEWRQITHKPIVSEVKQAAQLAWEGYLTSLEFMN